MKKVFLLFVLLVTSVMANAQLAGVDPASKVMPDAKKEAKRLTKEGWKVIDGGMDLVNQIDLGMKAAYVMMENASGEAVNRYILATGNGVNTIENIARKMARANAEAQIANALKSQVEAMVEREMINRQLSTTDAETIEQVRSQMMSRATANLRNLVPVLNIVKKEGKTVSVMIQYAYDLEALK